MRIGVHIAQVGQLADGNAVRRAAVAAEQVGYDSVWVADRILAPVDPRSSYPWTPDGSLPDELHRVLDPLGVLMFAAAVTERVRLGVSVLVAPWYPPVLLARSLTTLDRLSAGRLTLGLGVGWSLDEYESAGVPMRGLGVRLEETLDVLDAVWGDDPVEYTGAHVRIVPSTIQPKPLQRPRPPVLLAAYTPAGLDRVARRADGWNPAGLPVGALAPMWAQVRERAAVHGRDPDALSLVVRANMVVHTKTLGSDRLSYHGSVEQIATDLVATQDAGAHEVILGFRSDPSLDEALDTFARLAELLDDRRGRVRR